MAQRVRVVDFSPEWAERYEEEKQKIAAVLGENCLAIYHIGSTAVPGLAAKPIIDMLAAVRSLERVDAAAEAFAQLGYESLGEFGIPGRRYLRKGGDERTHQLHVFHGGDWANIARHLALRDYLRGRADEREAYAQLKRRLAQRFPRDIESYCDGKGAFVREMERRALKACDESWERLYLAARSVQRPRALSPLVEAGAVAAALLTERGSVYVGVCIDTACSLGMCAERSAIANMITCGEQRITRLVALAPDGRALPPCGACREMMMQLDPGAGKIEILRDHDSRSAVRLEALTPDWWYAERSAGES